MIGLIARVKIIDGKADDFVAVAKKLVERVNQDEPGALLYMLTKVRDSENTFCFIERYRDQAALDAHRDSPHYQEFAPQIGALLDGGVDKFVVDDIT